jgi:hypothetical protein
MKYVMYAAWFMVAAALNGQAATATFQYAEGTYAWITPDAPDASHAGAIWVLHVEGGTDDKFLLQWDYSAAGKIPAGQHIASATLRITTTKAESTVRTGCLGVWDMDVPWDATATYNSSSTSPTQTPWGMGLPGAQSVVYMANPLDTACGRTAAGVNLQFDLAAGVRRQYCHPDSNFGFVVDGFPGAYHFNITEPNSQADYGGISPVLLVTYDATSNDCLTSGEKILPPAVAEKVCITQAGGKVIIELATPNTRIHPLYIFGIKGTMVARLSGEKTLSGCRYSWDGARAVNGIYYAVFAGENIKAKSFAWVR